MMSRIPTRLSLTVHSSISLVKVPIVYVNNWRSHCRHYSINILQTGKQNTTENDSNVNQNKSKVQLLDEYKQWFPKDKLTGGLIERYKRLQKFPQEMVNVGIIYDHNLVQCQSKVIETLLADPLSSNNQEWFNRVLSRDKTINNKFVFDETIEATNGQYYIPSPILKSDLRPRYMSPDTITLNDLRIIEINDLSNEADLDQCHFFIYMINTLTSTIDLPKAITKKILLVVNDNSDYSPKSTESIPFPSGGDNSAHLIKINSKIAYDGIIDFLVHDTKASSNYLECLVDSNIFQLLKTIGWNLQTARLSEVYLNRITDDLSVEQININQLKQLYDDIRNTQLTKFSTSMHSEFLNQFIPNTTKFFKSLTWMKLYYKNDNIEYDLKDFFQNNFMNQSIENYNYYRGQIYSQLKNHNFGKYHEIESQINNPLLALKNDIINTRISNEIQPVVTSSLFYGLIFYQAPMTLLALGSYVLFDFQPNSSIAIFSLGLVVGLNYISKNWEGFTKKWSKQLFEQVRICLDQECITNGLIKELNHSYKQEKRLVDIKSSIVKGLRQSDN